MTCTIFSGVFVPGINLLECLVIDRYEGDSGPLRAVSDATNRTPEALGSACSSQTQYPLFSTIFVTEWTEKAKFH